MKSRQRRAEENKTPSLDTLARIKFRILPPFEGTIEIVNSDDMGRVCTLRISDFKSGQDAQLYAELLALGPRLMSACLSDVEQLGDVVKWFERRAKSLKQGSRKQKKYRRRIQ